MERGKRIKAIDGETNLPEAMIQHIQFFLNYKEAARTSLLSKSWFKAWATRPILHLDQRNFQIPKQLITDGFSESSKKIMRWHEKLNLKIGNFITDGFSESSKKIMRRYEKLNLKIENFRLCMKDTGTGCYSLANELIARAMGLGARDLTFEFLWKYSSSNRRTVDFVLPHEVLGSGNLGRLSVSGCRIDLQATDGQVGFSMLKFLSLRWVCIVGYSIWDILPNCPLIEELVLNGCTFSSRVGTHNGGTQVTAKPMSLTEFGNQNVAHQITQYRNLKCMILKKFILDPLFFHDTSRRFPRLKDLTLDECYVLGELQISSPSLEFLSIAPPNALNAKFDVPSLRKFTFRAFYLPILSFEAASREWESSDITIIDLHDANYDNSWLGRLKDFLMKLSLSKISLSLCFGRAWCKWSGMPFLYDIENGRDLTKPPVEHLTLWMSDAATTDCFSLLKGVYVTEDWLPIFKLLCKNLIQEEIENFCFPSRCMDDLEQVNVEGFDESIAQWQPLQWKALLDASKSPQNKRKIRFKLNPSSFS